MRREQVFIGETHFRVTIWRNRLTDDRMKVLNLNERQVKAVQFLKSKLTVMNTQYLKLTGVSRATAKRDLDELVKLRLIGNRLKKGSNGSPEHRIGNGSFNRHVVRGAYAQTKTN